MSIQITPNFAKHVVGILLCIWHRTQVITIVGTHLQFGQKCRILVPTARVVHVGGPAAAILVKVAHERIPRVNCLEQRIPTRYEDLIRFRRVCRVALVHETACGGNG